MKTDFIHLADAAALLISILGPFLSFENDGKVKNHFFKKTLPKQHVHTFPQLNSFYEQSMKRVPIVWVYLCERVLRGNIQTE